MARPGLSATTPLCRGAVVGGYEILVQLCSGGMGQLYEVADIALGRRALLKVLHERHRGRRDYAARLREEARLLAHLTGGRVPAVFGTGEIRDGQPYFVMERLFGRDLRFELGRFGVMSVPTSVRIVLDLLDTLAFIHGRAVVHRDVKLDNLILDDQGRLFLIDFGVARRTDAPLALTRPGIAMGTLRTMAPEQHVGHQTDERTDVYAAGLVLFELLTGRGPFDHVGRNPQALRAAHCATTPPLPSWCAPQTVPSAVEAVVMRALAKRAEERFATARVMAAALRDTAGYENIEGPTFVDPSRKGGAA